MTTPGATIANLLVSLVRLSAPYCSHLISDPLKTIFPDQEIFISTNCGHNARVLEFLYNSTPTTHLIICKYDASPTGFMFIDDIKNVSSYNPIPNCIIPTGGRFLLQYDFGFDETGHSFWCLVFDEEYYVIQASHGNKIMYAKKFDHSGIQSFVDDYSSISTTIISKIYHISDICSDLTRMISVKNELCATPDPFATRVVDIISSKIPDYTPV